MKTLGIIPARGGSKGIPKKNLQVVAGKPLIWWTCQCAKSSRLDDLICSTDSDEIADVVSACKIDVHLRPPELATDTSPVIATVRALLDLNDRYDVIVLLQPTNPLRQPRDIDRALDLLTAFTRADSVLSIVETESHPARLRRLDGSLVVPYDATLRDQRRQDLSEVYLRDGSIYAARTWLAKSGRLEGDHCLPLWIPRPRSLRVDCRYDLILADFLLTHPTVMLDS